MDLHNVAFRKHNNIACTVGVMLRVFSKAATAAARWRYFAIAAFKAALYSLLNHNIFATGALLFIAGAHCNGKWAATIHVLNYFFKWYGFNIHNTKMPDILTF